MRPDHWHWRWWLGPGEFATRLGEADLFFDYDGGHLWAFTLRTPSGAHQFHWDHQLGTFVRSQIVHLDPSTIDAVRDVLVAMVGRPRDWVLSDIQRQVVDTIANAMLGEEWVSGRRLRKALGMTRPDFEPIATALEPRYLRARDGDRGDEYSLTLPGLLASQHGLSVRKILDAIIATLRTKFSADPDVQTYTLDEVVTTGGFENGLRDLIIATVRLTGLMHGGQGVRSDRRNEHTWGVPLEIEEIAGLGSVDELFRWFQRHPQPHAVHCWPTAPIRPGWDQGARGQRSAREEPRDDDGLRPQHHLSHEPRDMPSTTSMTPFAAHRSAPGAGATTERLAREQEEVARPRAVGQADMATSMQGGLPTGEASALVDGGMRREPSNQTTDNRGASVTQQIVVHGNATFGPMNVGDPPPGETKRPWAADDGGTRPHGGDPLGDAYASREALLIDGEDVTAIDAEIRELRRALRHGPTLHPGEYLGNGRFKLVEVIGRGGFALVWKAYDRKERKLVAVKVLHGELARDPSRRERLFRGAKRMAALQHPNVVRVLVPEGEDEGFHYFVMELVPGGDLHRAVIEGKIDAERGLALVESIADALTVAHVAGLVHRDVKPENILLRDDGTAVLTDFDLVQANDTTGGTRTSAMGTVVYAAPEQSVDASRVDHRADVYGLGMTAVFCVYGQKLPLTAMFNRDKFLEDLSCAAELREVLRRAVAIEPGERYDGMASLRSALETARQAVGVAEAPSQVEPVRPPARGSARRTVSRSPARSPEREVKVVRGVELVLVPGGRFSMGSPKSEHGRFDDEGPEHEVELASFWLARTPVTNAQYRAFLDAPDRDPKVAEPLYWGHRLNNEDSQPVVGVSWRDAKAYCEWAGLRLPTEAQWEYACRAGTTTRYHSGDGEEDLKKVGWYTGTLGRWLHAVGELAPNAWGLHDMHGNVHEWCEDTWVASYEGAVHRPGDGLRVQPVGAADRVVRGGDFGSEARRARSAFRVRYPPGHRGGEIGFRPAQGHDQ